MNMAHDTIQCNTDSLMSLAVIVFSGRTDRPTRCSAPRGGFKRSVQTIFGMAMDTDVRTLRSLAQTYFDAAYEMDAEKFASIFHPSSSVTKVGDDGNVGVTPIAGWLAAVRTMKAPIQQGLERDDRVLFIDVEGELALLKLKLQISPRYFTDMLSCLKVNGTWKIVQKVMTSKT